MAHQQQKDFCVAVKAKFPHLFDGKWVLDIGSLDINGNNQHLFDNCGYIGVDLNYGKNVDFVSKGHELQFPDESFDVIVSTECFEHDFYYEKTINNIVRMLKPGGLFLFTCATTGRPEHGTRRTTPHDAPFTQEFGEWGDYYKNLEESDIRSCLDVDEFFSDYEFSTQDVTFDLRFWGIKRGEGSKEVNTYSFLMDDSHSQQQILKIKNLEGELDEARSECGDLQGRIAALSQAVENLAITKSSLMLAEARLKALEEEFREQSELLGHIVRSNSWRLTRPLRFLGRLLRGQHALAFEPLLRGPGVKKFIVKARLARNAFSYVLRGDFKGLHNRLIFYRQDAIVSRSTSAAIHAPRMNWGIMTPGHTLFIAHLIAERLAAHGWAVEIMTSAPDKFSLDLYVVICPQIFDKLPPGEKRVAFQMEQSVSSRWFNDEYSKILENSLAVLEYSLANLRYLATKGVAYPHVHYLPIGATESYGVNVEVGLKKYDVLFYGDSLSSPRRRRMLDALKQNFSLFIANNLFGENMIKVLKEARVVVNIHYYENALLETPRIQECLSLGLHVVSESAQDQSDYPELQGAVTYFDEGSTEGMIAAVKRALKDESTITNQAVRASQQRFVFMFDRFLIAMGLLPATHVQNMRLPLPESADTFALSLPETINRRRVFEDVRPVDCIIFDGIRRRPGWVGCGLSYAALAMHAMRNDLKNITIMEDDVILPVDYPEALAVIKQFLEKSRGSWDIFAGLIAVLNPSAEVISVEKFYGRTFVTINKMTSMVFNIYSESALEVFCAWDPSDEDSSTNTIDRYLESRKHLRVVTTLPFLAGHREEVYSTLWGFENSRYKELIAESEALLARMVGDFLAKSGETC